MVVVCFQITAIGFFSLPTRGVAALTFARGRQGRHVIKEIGIFGDEPLVFMGQTWGFARASGVLFAFAVAIKTFFITSAHLFHHERKPFLS